MTTKKTNDTRLINNCLLIRFEGLGKNPQFRIHQDELVVLSYPGPDRSVSLENLRKGKAQPRRYRNRRIGEFFKELEMTEGRSTGIPKIINAMGANGSPPPEFEFDADYSYFMVTLPVHPKAVEKASSETMEHDGTKLALSRHQVGTRLKIYCLLPKQRDQLKS